MSSPDSTLSPISEALANDDIVFSSPEALRALPIGSSWPGPCLPAETAPPSRDQKRNSKLLPGEKDPQPAFRLPIALIPPRRHNIGMKQTQPPPCEPPSGLAAPSRRHEAVGPRTQSELSHVVAGLSRRHNDVLAATTAIERSKQLARTSGPTGSSGEVAANHGQCSEQGDEEDDAHPKNKEKGRDKTENLSPRTSSDLDPIFRGAPWPAFHSPSSRSSSGSWVTARGEDSQEVSEKGGKKYGVAQVRPDAKEPNRR